MNEKLEKLKRAKAYLEQLADGYDPISGRELLDDSVLNNVKISRSFFFVADVLNGLIEDIGKTKPASKKHLSPFSISEEDKFNIRLSATPLQITKFCGRINEITDTEKMQKLQVTAFGKWLLAKGFLEVEMLSGKRSKKPTPMGEKIGISYELRTTAERQYYHLKYSKDAQQFLLDNLDEIIQISNGSATRG